MRTMIVKQRAGRRWIVVGQFATDRSDAVSLREELRKWLFTQGILDPNLKRFCLAAA